MDVVYVWNYLNKKYNIDRFNVTQFDKLFITDIRVVLNDELLNQKYVYASGCHYTKDLSLIKALSELIERLVFLSPFVGPIEFINGAHYTPDINQQLVPLSLVTPYFSIKPVFSTHGHACHTESPLAILAAENEYYEHHIKNALLETLAQGTLSEEKESDITIHGVDDISILKSFKKIIIYYPSFYFCLVWHPLYKHVIGSACNQSLEKTIEKAFFEGLSLLQATSNVKDNTELMEELDDYTDIYPGKYLSTQVIPKPLLIRRHSQILTDLKLCLFQAVDHV